jgi:hypothetical protein
MPSTYSSLKIQLMATGENNTTWGAITNLNLGTAIEEAIVGSADVTFASANVTLTLTDTNTSQTARNVRLRCTGTTGGSTRNLVVPSIEKPYIVQNDCANSVVVKTAAGTGIAVPAGKTMWVYNDGTNVVDAVTRLSSLTLGTALAVTEGGTGQTSLTAGYVLKGSGTSAISSGIIYDNGTNVGVGTASPGSKLDVNGSVTVANAGQYRFGAGGVRIEGDTTSNYVAFFNDSGAERMRIISGGNVGIGTTTPGTKLEVNGAVTAGAESGVSYYVATNAAIRNTASAGNTMHFDSGVGAGSTTGDFQFRATNGYTTRLFIRGSDGNVGIGTTSPGVSLDVVGGIRVRGGVPGALGVNNNGYAFNTPGDTDSGMFSSADGQLEFYSNNAERMRIGPAGQIGLSGANYGTSGQVLISQGSGSAPIWTTISPGTGTVTSVSGTGTVSGLTLTGTVTTSGSLTLGGTLTLTSGQVTTALGYTPYNSSNPAGYTTNTGTVTSVSGTGSANGLSLSGTVTTSGDLTLSGSVTSVATGATIDGVTIGYRNIPRSTTSGTATTADVGKCIAVSAGITIPNSTFAAGDAISIYNDSGSSITITAGVTTLRQAGTANTGNRTLAARGMATIWFNSATEAIISGAGVS